MARAGFPVELPASHPIEVRRWIANPSPYRGVHRCSVNVDAGALRAGLYEVVEASIAGSIVGNILLVLGAAMLAGGLKHPQQHFSAVGARARATMLSLASIALIVSSAFAVAAGSTPAALHRLSVSMAVVLLIVYALYLIFALVSHPELFAEAADAAGKPANALLFAKENGSAWGRAHQHRPLRDACTAGKIAPAASFHVLRHTYATLLLRAGVPLPVAKFSHRA
jgi:hypothetical protein